MKLLLAAIVLFLIVETNAQWYKFPGEVIQGSRDMWRAFTDMKKANWKNSDKYFHARGNYDAAQRGPGGRWAAEVISNGRAAYNWIKGRDREDIGKDLEANQWGRNGGNPNRYRPRRLPSKY
ncbi:amyloid protein A-like [Pagrus major]|uniref:amyloid protein A-like n=1 Tax=Pagrus major TaxID=143350 RepID=UPI003CC87A08